MNKSQLIKNAILSEKSYALMDKGIYTFLVERDAKKDQIKKTVERQFQVSVTNVRVLGKSAKTKRITGTRKTITVGAGKKAVVSLQKGQSIALFSTKSEKTKNKKLAHKSEKQVEENKSKGLLSRFKKSENKKEREK